MMVVMGMPNPTNILANVSQIEIDEAFRDGGRRFRHLFPLCWVVGESYESLRRLERLLPV